MVKRQLRLQNPGGAARRRLPAVRLSRANAPAVGVGGIESQARFARDVRGAGDDGSDLALVARVPAVARREGAADQTLLDPRLAFPKPVVGGEACELGAGARAARGAVVGSARTQDEVAAVHAGTG